MSEEIEALRKQHREDGETLMREPNLLAAARRAHTLLVQIEVDSGEFYRETAWLTNAIEAESRPAPPDQAQAREAAERIVAMDDGLPDADDELDYLDATSVARAYLSLTSPVPAQEDGVWAEVAELATAMMLSALNAPEDEPLWEISEADIALRTGNPAAIRAALAKLKETP